MWLLIGLALFATLKVAALPPIPMPSLEACKVMEEKWKSAPFPDGVLITITKCVKVGKDESGGKT